MGVFVLVLSQSKYQDKRKARITFTLLFSRTLRYARKSEHSGCAPKSSVQGLRNGAPLLKTDRFGFLTVAQLSVRCASSLNKHQKQSRSEFLIFPGPWVVRRMYRRVSGKSTGTLYQDKRKAHWPILSYQILQWLGLSIGEGSFVTN